MSTQAVKPFQLAENELSPTIHTFMGKGFNFLDISEDQIDIRDIAHSLSMICRFGGHTREFYSVAQHCISACRLVPRAWSLEALLHDAEEAYVGDTLAPIKHLLGTQYKQISNNISLAIRRKFHLKVDDHGIIKDIDKKLVMAEAKQLTTWPSHQWVDWECADIVIHPMMPHVAELKFLEEFERCVRGRESEHNRFIPSEDAYANLYPF